MHTTKPRTGRAYKGPEIDAEKLRWLRENAMLSQVELADKTGNALTPHAISQLERGARTHPYPRTVRNLAAALGVEPKELIKRS